MKRARLFNLAGRLAQSRFLRDVGAMSVGTLAAQAINIASIALLARLYPPAEFGLLGIFYALTMTLSPAVSGKLDEALIVAEPQAIVARIVAAAIRVSLLSSGLVLAVLIAAPLVAPGGTDLTGLGSRLGLLVPLGLLLQGLFSIANCLGVRQKQFSEVARVKVLQALVVAAANVAVWLAGAPTGGLIIGTLAGLALSTLLLWRVVDAPLSPRLIVRDRSMPSILSSFRDYPLYSAPGAVLYGISYQLPILVISRFFSTTIVGYYALLVRTAIAPLGFVSIGIGHVHVRKVAEMANSGRPILPYLLKVAGALALLMAIPTIIFMLWAPGIFAVVFGEQWRQAGAFLQILMPALAVRMVVTTFGGTLESTRNNQLSFVWKVIAFVSTIAVFLIVAPSRDIERLLYAQLFLDLALYGLFFLFIVYAAWRPRNGTTPPGTGTPLSQAPTD